MSFLFIVVAKNQQLSNANTDIHWKHMQDFMIPETATSALHTFVL